MPLPNLKVSKNFIVDFANKSCVSFNFLFSVYFTYFKNLLSFFLSNKFFFLEAFPPEAYDQDEFSQ